LKRLCKTPHVAFVTREALWHPSLEVNKPGLRQFVRIPKGYAHGGFTMQWVAAGREDVAMVRFEMWRRRPRRPKK
jgi:hypothetical protein